MQGAVAATHAARRDDRRRTHTGKCVHGVTMMSPMRGQSGRSRESEDSKTDKNAFGHSQLLCIHPVERNRIYTHGNAKLVTKQRSQRHREQPNTEQTQVSKSAEQHRL